MTARIVTSRIDVDRWVFWQAWDDRMGADTSPIGNGPTEVAAVADLQEMLADMEGYPCRPIPPLPVWPYEERW